MPSQANQHETAEQLILERAKVGFRDVQAIGRAAQHARVQIVAVSESDDAALTKICRGHKRGPLRSATANDKRRGIFVEDAKGAGSTGLSESPNVSQRLPEIVIGHGQGIPARVMRGLSDQEIRGQRRNTNERHQKKVRS